MNTMIHTDREVVEAALTLLIHAKRRIYNPKHWTTGANAVDHNGYLVDLGDKTAVAWCASGSMSKERLVLFQYQDAWLESKAYSYAWDRLNANSQRLFACEMVTLNDQANHSCVMLVFNTTIGEMQREVM